MIRFFLFLATLALCSSTAYAQTTKIAVAANMKGAFTEILQSYKSQSGSEIQVVYGSSGNFSAQILNGAPFSLFIAADEHFPLELYKKGKTINEGAIYAIGKLALIVKTSSGIQIGSSKTEIAKAIAKANKVAIAKPELAPYGKAAIEYLKNEGLFDLTKDKLVYGDNVGVATNYVVTGAADLGFTALSLAKSSEVAKDTNYILIGDGLYEPIKQRMVLIKGASRQAQELYQYMQGTQAKSILQKYGYMTP